MHSPKQRIEEERLGGGSNSTHGWSQRTNTRLKSGGRNSFQKNGEERPLRDEG